MKNISIVDTATKKMVNGPLRSWDDWPLSSEADSPLNEGNLTVHVLYFLLRYLN
jgi:hypothetical protein